MSQLPQAKEERDLQSYALKNFLAVNTTNSRVACPETCLYDLTNLQPIGYSNLHSVPDISSVLHDYAGDTIYYDADANVNNVEYLIAAATDGALFAYNIGSSVVTQIATPGTLSGNGTRITQWKNSQILVIDANGYFNWNGSGSIVSIGGVTGAPSSGSCIAVYQGRVWIAQGRVLFYSAPDTFADFTTASGGGFRNLTDSTLRSTVQALFAANGFLYVFGTTSVDSISDVYVPAGASPPTPNMTYLNLDAIIGTDQPSSICAYGRLVVFANRYGVYSLYGTSITSISSPDPNNSYNSSIDGTWQYVDFSQPISAGQFLCNNILCVGWLIRRLNDPIFGTGPVIACYQGNAAGGRWWFGNFGALTRVSTGIVSTVSAIFGYVGNKLYQLFQNINSSPASSFMGPLWDFGDPFSQKQIIRAGIAITVFKQGGTFTLNIDTTNGSFPVPNLVPGSVVWLNNSNAVVTWINNFSQPVSWISGSYLTYWAGAQNGLNTGNSKYVGFSFSSTGGTVYEINALLMDYKKGPRWIGN